MKDIDQIQERLPSLALPPAAFPPADIVRDTPHKELNNRIAHNAELLEIKLNDKHWRVINFLFSFYINCCQSRAPIYLRQKDYWNYVDSLAQENTNHPYDAIDNKYCEFGQLSSKEAIKAYPVYRILLKAFKNEGGKKYLYTLFPFSPLYTIHLLAQLPRLMNDADPHSGTAY